MSTDPPSTYLSTDSYTLLHLINGTEHMCPTVTCIQAAAVLSSAIYKLPLPMFTRFSPFPILPKSNAAIRVGAY